MKRRVLALRICALALGLGLWLAGIAVAEAHDCSSPGDCEQTGGYNGTIATTGGVIAIISTLIGSTLLGGGGTDGTNLAPPGPLTGPITEHLPGYGPGPQTPGITGGPTAPPGPPTGPHTEHPPGDGSGAHTPTGADRPAPP